jgi:hypothetical protein
MAPRGVMTTSLRRRMATQFAACKQHVNATATQGVAGLRQLRFADVERAYDSSRRIDRSAIENTP